MIHRFFPSRAVSLPLISALLALASTDASANYFCTGTVDAVGVNPDGTVYLSSSGAGFSYVSLCMIGTTYNGVSSDTCKSILATLLAAKASGLQTQWAFNDSLSCTTHTAWAPLTGWYYGPIAL